MLDYDNASSATDIRFERIGDVLTIKLPKEGFVRGAGNLLSSRYFWAVVTIMMLAMNGFDLVRWIRGAFQGQFIPASVTAGTIALFFLQPAFLVCMYVLIVCQSSVTIRLYRTELVHSMGGLFNTTRDTGYARRKITGVRNGWLNLSILLDRPRWLGFPHCAQLFFGRTRNERERVAAAIRNWLEPVPPELPR